MCVRGTWSTSTLAASGMLRERERERGGEVERDSEKERTRESAHGRVCIREERTLESIDVGS